MKYKAIVHGVHCAGCKNLLVMTFEENGFTDTDVNVTTGETTFASNETIDTIAQKLEKIFEGLTEYHIHELEQIN